VYDLGDPYSLARWANVEIKDYAQRIVHCHRCGHVWRTEAWKRKGSQVYRCYWWACPKGCHDRDLLSYAAIRTQECSPWPVPQEMLAAALAESAPVHEAGAACCALAGVLGWDIKAAYDKWVAGQAHGSRSLDTFATDIYHCSESTLERHIIGHLGYPNWTAVRRLNGVDSKAPGDPPPAA